MTCWACRRLRAASSPAPPWPPLPPCRGPPRASAARRVGRGTPTGSSARRPFSGDGDEVHGSVKALGLLGLGRERVERVPVDGQGRMSARAGAAGRRHHRLCPGGQRQHRSLRSLRGDLRRRPAPGPGCTWTAPSACGPRRAGLRHLPGLRTGRLLGHRRAQVAERPLRLRHRLVPAPSAAGRPCRYRAYMSRRAARPHALHPRDVPAQPRVWSCGRTLQALGRYGRGRTGGAPVRPRPAFRRAAAPGRLPVLNEVVFNQVLVACGGREETLPSGPPCRQRAKPGAAAPPGRGDRHAHERLFLGHHGPGHRTHRGSLRGRPRLIGLCVFRIMGPGP